jgi:hypothetical protein
MRPDDRANSVLQRCDDPTSIGVILGIGREDHAEVEVEPDRIASDLDIAFFEDVD